MPFQNTYFPFWHHVIFSFHKWKFKIMGRKKKKRQTRTTKQHHLIFCLSVYTLGSSSSVSNRRLHLLDCAITELTFPPLGQWHIINDLENILLKATWTVSLVSFISPSNKPISKRYAVHSELLSLPSDHSFLFQVLIDLLCNNSP